MATGTKHPKGQAPGTTAHWSAAVQPCRAATKERNSSLTLHVDSTRARCSALASTFEQSRGVSHGSSAAALAGGGGGTGATDEAALGATVGAGVLDAAGASPAGGTLVAGVAAASDAGGGALARVQPLSASGPHSTHALQK